MTNARRWLAIDADMFGKQFIDDLYDTFGWAGIGTWTAFLCACKRSRTPGRVSFISEADARAQLGIIGYDLVDNHGDSWTLDVFWTFTGRKKQTRKTSHGRIKNVSATHWERWQDDARMQTERERKRRQRAQKCPENVQGAPDADWDNVPPDLDLDLDLDNDLSTTKNGDGSTKSTDPLAQRLANTVPNRTYQQAARTINALRAEGINDTVIDEVIGYATERNDIRALSYVAEVARDWMAQRDPTWRSQ